MNWTMKADDGGGDFVQPPTGPHAAVLTRIIDIGTHTDVSPQYGENRRHQVIFMWEIAETMDDGRPFTVQKFYTLSLNEKANLRKDLESWRGVQFKDGEEIVIDAALGKPCMLNIGRTANDKSKVLSVSKMPKGMPPLEPVGPLLVYRIDEPNESVYEQLSEFHQRKISESEEWNKPKEASNPQPVAMATAENDPDDDIPGW